MSVLDPRGPLLLISVATRPHVLQYATECNELNENLELTKLPGIRLLRVATCLLSMVITLINFTVVYSPRSNCRSFSNFRLNLLAEIRLNARPIVYVWMMYIDLILRRLAPRTRSSKCSDVTVRQSNNPIEVHTRIPWIHIHRRVVQRRGLIDPRETYTCRCRGVNISASRVHSLRDHRLCTYNDYAHPLRTVYLHTRILCLCAKIGRQFSSFRRSKKVFNISFSSLSQYW